MRNAEGSLFSLASSLLSQLRDSPSRFVSFRTVSMTPSPVVSLSTSGLQYFSLLHPLKQMFKTMLKRRSKRVIFLGGFFVNPCAFLSSGDCPCLPGTTFRQRRHLCLTSSVCENASYCARYACPCNHHTIPF